MLTHALPTTHNHAADHCVDFGPLVGGADVLATRWTPLIVRNLLLGSRTFSDLREGCPGISRTLLTQRLRMLERHGIVDRRTIGVGSRVHYDLAPAGHALAPVIAALGAWGASWIERAPEHFVAEGIVRAICAGIVDGELPEEGRHTVRFDVDGGTHRERYWVLVHHGRAELCLRPPADQDDFVVRTDPTTLARWHQGRCSLGQAVAARRMQVEGPRWLERLVASWGGRRI